MAQDGGGTSRRTLAGASNQAVIGVLPRVRTASGKRRSRRKDHDRLVDGHRHADERTDDVLLQGGGHQGGKGPGVTVFLFDQQDVTSRNRKTGSVQYGFFLHLRQARGRNFQAQGGAGIDHQTDTGPDGRQ